MSQLTKLAFQNEVYTSKEEWRKYTVVFNGWQNDEDNVDTVLYMGDYTTTSAVATGTIAFADSGGPQLARKFTNLYTYGTDNRPYARRDTSFPQITAAAANDGRSWTTGIPAVSINSTDDYIAIVMKNSVGSLTNTVKIGSDITTDYYEFDFANVGTDWGLYIAKISDATVTGTPGLTGLNEIEITVSAAGTAEVYSINFGNNPYVFLGSQLTLDFDCLEEFGFEDLREQAEVKCFNYTTQQTPTNAGFNFTLTTNTINDKFWAASFGEVQKRGSVDQMRILDAPAIASGVSNVGAGLDETRFASVVVNDAPLNRVSNAADVGETGYHYNSTTGDVAFPDTDDYNGFEPAIKYVGLTTANYFDIRNLKTGFVGQLFAQRESANGTTEALEFFKVQINKVMKEQGDANVSATVEMTALPKRSGTDFLMGRAIKS